MSKRFTKLIAAFCRDNDNAACIRASDARKPSASYSFQNFAWTEDGSTEG